MSNEELSALKKQVYDLTKLRQDVIHRVLGTKKFIAAQVYERQTKCGKPTCKCAKGELHGPFLWIYQKKKGRKATSTTVAKDKTREARELAGRYETLLKQRQKIRETDRKINELLNEIELFLEKGIDEYVVRKEKA